MFLASRIVSLIGAVGLFVASLLTWYWGEGRGIRVHQNAWQGEESLAAVIVMLVAVTLLALGWAVRGGWLVFGILELILNLVSFGLIVFFILHNQEPVVVSGRTVPTGIGAGAWIGLVSAVAMIVGAILNLPSGGPYPRRCNEGGDDLFLDEEDEWEDLPRRRRPRPSRPVRRPPPRRRLTDE
jgi:hypothetical protein